MSGIYDSYYGGISVDDWEHFALDFLCELGFSVISGAAMGPDGGKDGVVWYEGKTYIVSCKHYIQSGRSVGVSEEHSILDRIAHHGANGFIGFYSTSVSQTLQDRFLGLNKEGYHCIYFDKYKISEYLPRVRSTLLQKYGSPKNFKYMMNVEEYECAPLNCLVCGTDVLTDSMIPLATAMIALNIDNQLKYIYGCKHCLNVNDLGSVGVWESLHFEQLLGWNNYVNSFVAQHPTSPNFYFHKNSFDTAILQRMYPATWGTWLGY
ncbi:hypothetical protein GCM10007161_13620 [Ignatzschineria indica]|uniref:Restriction endonuclease type IV Mrr domain-containing protein n=1 Tax=Ignatzschineria indica TaxID=472583 RepID=A0A2U2AJM9_9GAMM|nr:restriction endonuclease [Ignatzschineria indica]PWD83042.1 hypothetical protein DC082_06350 [Ignatzschineria indica]GGZ83374.1 hypothetical protein GCM10007161_13620 [Ignatzschineria indica]